MSRNSYFKHNLEHLNESVIILPALCNILMPTALIFNSHVLSSHILSFCWAGSGLASSKLVKEQFCWDEFQFMVPQYISASGSQSSSQTPVSSQDLASPSWCYRNLQNTGPCVCRNQHRPFMLDFRSMPGQHSQSYSSTAWAVIACQWLRSSLLSRVGVEHVGIWSLRV